MSATTLKLSRLYGLKGDVKDNIQYIDELNVLYPCGYNIVNYSIEKKVQRFLPMANSGQQESSGDISALAMSISRGHRSKVLAVAERGSVSSRPVVSVFDLSSMRRRGKGVLETSDVNSHEYVSMCFSPDGKYLLTQGGAPDWMLVNWQWEKGRPVQAAKVSNKAGAVIHQCSYCPTDPTVVCVSGNGILRFLHLEQSEFKSIPFSMGKREPQNYLCHAWIDDKILVGTDTGDILVFENAEFRGVLPSSPSDGKSIDSIATFSKGFVCGCDEGVLYVFERDEKEIYKQSKSFQIEGNFVRIKNIAISPSEDNVICTLENNQAYVLGLSNTDILKSEEMNFEPLSQPFHHLPVTGLDTCLRKPLVATCGLDRSVRVWKYRQERDNHSEQSGTLEVMRFFSEQPLCVAFHPSGLQLLVGFNDNLRLMNLLIDEIRPFKDFSIKSCREVKFSNGGQYFAAANGTIVQVYTTYTCELIGSFGNHKGKVVSLYWTPDDSAIVSAGAGGGVFKWAIEMNAKTLTKPNSKKLLTTNFTSAVGSDDGKIYVVGADKRLHVIGEDGELRDDFDAGGQTLTQIALLNPPQKIGKHKVIFAGSDDGVVRVIPLPLEQKSYDLRVHTGSITRMRITPDDQYLFTVSEDGSLAQYQIESKKDSSGMDSTLPFAEEILVTKTDLEEKTTLIQDLNNKVQELQAHNALQLQLTEMRYKEKLRDITQKFHNELEVDRSRYASLEEEKEALTQQFHLKLEALNGAQGQKQNELKSHHRAKLRAERDRYNELDKRIVAMHNEWDDRTKAREEAYSTEKNGLNKELDQKQKAEVIKFKELEKARDEVLKDMERTVNWMKEDADKEIDELKANYDRKLTHERLTTRSLKHQNAILKRQFGALRDDINENLDELQRKKETQLELYSQISSLEKDIAGHLKEIKERESTIDDKVSRIFELRKKNQELEKFKFVLDYKITELQRQIKPREVQMKETNEQIGQMEVELKSYKKESAHLGLDVRQLNLKLNGMEKEILSTKAARKEVEFNLRKFKTELHEVHMHDDDPKMLKDGVKRLYQRHVTSQLSAAKKKGGADDMHNDYQRQRKFLERSVDALNGNLKKDVLVHKKDNSRIMDENITLIKEINQLRREIAILRNSQKLKEQMKRVSRKQRLDTLASAMAVRKGEIDGEIEKQQEQIRALKNQIAFYKQMVEEEDKTAMKGVRPATRESTTLPPINGDNN